MFFTLACEKTEKTWRQERSPEVNGVEFDQRGAWELNNFINFLSQE